MLLFLHCNLHFLNFALRLLLCSKNVTSCCDPEKSSRVSSHTFSGLRELFWNSGSLTAVLAAKIFLEFRFIVSVENAPFLLSV